MKTDRVRLGKSIRQATGPDSGIDRAVAALLDGGGEDDAVPPYTSSVDACIALIRRTLPDWHWHVGHGAMGVVPYASMTRNDENAGPVHVEATASTVPLALLGALIRALESR